jgi:hypothetical protein
MAKTRKVTVLLDAGEYERFEGYCIDQGHKKSTLAARLIREHLDRQAFSFQRPLPLAATSASA